MSLIYNPAKEILFNREMLHTLPTPESQGRFHQPYAFGDYVDNIYDALRKEGIAIRSDEYAVSRDGNKMFGMIEIGALEGDYIAADDWKLMLGVRGSHDQSIARGLTLGSQVMVCSNLCFHGSLGTLRTKQTTNIAQRIPSMIRDAVQRIPEQSRIQGRAFEAYKNMDIRKHRGDAALVELYRRDALTAAQLATAICEWDKPSYDEHGAYGDTVWKLFNAATQALKPTGNNVSMELIRQRSETVSGYMNELARVSL
jgi:hypothetical protein